jgi:hypothetical protein
MMRAFRKDDDKTIENHTMVLKSSSSEGTSTIQLHNKESP